jgi:Zn-dependent protease
MATREVWSLNLGRWWGVQIHLHMFFLLFATLTCYLVWVPESQKAFGALDDDATMSVISLVSMAILFLSVLVHEIGHCLVASRLGGSLDNVVLGPLGGLRPIRIPHDPQSELLAVVAGPMTSLAVCLVCLSAIAASGATNVFGLLHPLSPSSLFETSGGDVLALPTILRLTCWINWLLVLVNLIPAFPFDGGRACKAFLQSIRPDLEPRHAMLLVANLARIVAISLLVAACFFRESDPETVVPTWLALVLLSIFVFFSTRVEEYQPNTESADDELFGYDFSQGYTSLERHEEHEGEDQKETAPPVSFVAGWLGKWKQKQEARRRQTEQEEDRRLDEILARLHEVGAHGLSSAERDLLRRVSARYRSREKS